MGDPSGWFWAILGVLGVGGLGLAIAYASFVRRRWRNPETDLAKNAATGGALQVRRTSEKSEGEKTSPPRLGAAQVKGHS
jgi:hypothetical protein